MVCVNEERLWQAHQQMGEIGSLPGGGCCRLALSEEDRLGRELFIRWATEIGCEVRIDLVGNIFARRAGAHTEGPAVATGSHLDTQPHAGLFDGIYGVLAGLEIFRSLDDARIRTVLPLETIVWTNEECVRFTPPTAGSMVFTEQLTAADLHAEETIDGTTVREDLIRMGHLGEPLTYRNRPLDSFVEAHIEQGPILEHQAKTIGVVTGIQGARMYEVRLQGRDDHAGTTPMGMRRDAFDGAARMAVRLNTMALNADPAIRLTIGRCDILPNSASTVPGQAAFQIDLRHPDAAQLDSFEVLMRGALEQIAAELDLDLKVADISRHPAVQFESSLVDLIEEKAVSLGYPHMRMLSGAGHDAANLAQVVPTAMIFVPCKGGISHNESEFAEPSDLAAGANVMLQVMLARAGVLEDCEFEAKEKVQ